MVGGDGSLTDEWFVERGDLAVLSTRPDSAVGLKRATGQRMFAHNRHVSFAQSRLIPIAACFAIVRVISPMRHTEGGIRFLIVFFVPRHKHA